jgi:hypothetical protein
MDKNTLPSKEGVVADEGSDFTVTDTEVNSGVDHVGEVGDGVLKVVVLDLHNTGGVLDNSHLRRQEHLGGTVKQAVDGLVNC